MFPPSSRRILAFGSGEDMKISAEFITALPHSERREITVLMSGYRIDFSVDEASALVRAVGDALRAMPGDFERPPASATPSDQTDIVAQVMDQVISWAEITDQIGTSKR
jgi:hypothetical protein